MRNIAILRSATAKSLTVLTGALLAVTLARCEGCFRRRDGFTRCPSRPASTQGAKSEGLVRFNWTWPWSPKPAAVPAPAGRKPVVDVFSQHRIRRGELL